MKNIIINNNNTEIMFNPAFRRNVFFPREKNHGKKKRERKKNFERNVSK